MCSSEYAELRGISGMAVAKRCALLVSPAKQQLLWWIQAMSLSKHGLKRLVADLLSAFPERLGTFSMHKFGITAGKSYKPSEVSEIRCELEPPNVYQTLSRIDGAANEESFSARELQAQCRSMALGESDSGSNGSIGKLPLEEFLVELCIDPGIYIELNEPESAARGIDPAEAEIREMPTGRCEQADLVYFEDIIGALVEHKRRYEERVKAGFCLTAIGQQVWKQLDDALRTRTMIVIEGREGRGKTEAVRAWCNCHSGVARFASLDRTSSKTAQVRELAKALGIGHGNARRALEMQTSVKEVLQTSSLMMVIDEAHYLFNQGLWQSGPPDMLDWIDTALCNPPLPIALVTTPQFMDCMERAVSNVGWNYRQFKRRSKYVRLSENNTPHDVEEVARKLLPGADKATIKQIMGYEAMSKRDLSAVGDVVREAKLLADKDGASQVTFGHVKRAIYEVLIPSDLPWREMEQRLQQKQFGRKAPRQAPALEPEAGQEPAETLGRDITPRLSPGASRGSRLRFQEADPAQVSEPDEAILTPG
jgi:DNA transposition AAA+ family ATPase